jgi:hypothetical protein
MNEPTNNPKRQENWHRWGCEWRGHRHPAPDAEVCTSSGGSWTEAPKWGDLPVGPLERME